MVTLTDTSITVPKLSYTGFTHEEIPLASIRKLEQGKQGFNTILMIHHAKGKAALARFAFQSKKDFEEIVATLAGHLNPGAKKPPRSATPYIAKRLEEKRMDDAVLAVKHFAVEIGEKARHASISWSRTTDLKKISESMAFTENGEPHYVVFAELTGTRHIDYQTHATLLFLINDIIALKVLGESQHKTTASNLAEQILDYRTRITLQACYLEHYLDAVEKHMALDHASLNNETVEAIHHDTHNAYVEHLRELAGENDYLKKKIEEKINSGTLGNIPLFPMAMSVILNDETKKINHLYMTDEMYEQAIGSMASTQAKAMANS